MKPHIVKFFNFLEAKDGNDIPLSIKFSNLDKFKITKDELNVKDTLELSFSKIISLPDGLKVKEHLYLSHCKLLKSLPDDLEVGWDLILYNCTSLTSLPDGLQIGETLILSGCTSLKTLPSGLTVGWDLYLRDTPIAEMYSADEIRTMIENKGGYVGGNTYI